MVMPFFFNIVLTLLSMTSSSNASLPCPLPQKSSFPSLLVSHVRPSRTLTALLGCNPTFKPCHLPQPKTHWIECLIRHFSSYLEVLGLSTSNAVVLLAAATYSVGVGWTPSSATCPRHP
ncbi:hypothetical protein B0J13DRAFT_557773 [Dactylonectria estremocensis]|uniref:Secreted protein n=1 Tax=Dactylonectria estremocensis TaxID=1079267 RepID=A0A9P9EN13_9HYPO|nr:hypothetical protein B0J13DRAFT_557773 [Dactylonectria estremocensis]